MEIGIRDFSTIFFYELFIYSGVSVTVVLIIRKLSC